MGWVLTASEMLRVAARPAVRAGGLMVLAAAAFAATPTTAEPMIDKGVSGDSARLDVVLNGKITPSCRLGGGGDVDLGELTGGEQVEASFALGCNVPFELNFQSMRGGLAHVTKPRGEGPYAGTLGYTLTVTVPTLKPAPAVMRGAFNSEELASGRTLSSGEAVAAGGGHLQLRTAMPRGAGLLAGEYSEVLSVTVAPRV